jgi:hypothetical protein
MDMQTRKLRQRMETAVERLLAALDAIDGDPDLEATCEDEGGACEDEGSNDDREPDIAHLVPAYRTFHDQTRYAVNGYMGVELDK